jgi:hypothetical protein
MLDKNSNQKNILGIFAGRGNLPKILIEQCKKEGRKFILFLLNSEDYLIDYSPFNPVFLSYGSVEEFLEILKNKNIQEMVFVGAVNKPNFSEIKVDKTGAILVAKILANKILGDDAVLRTVINFFEKRGVKILPINEILDCVISKKTVLSKIKPDENDLENIKIAEEAIKYFAKFDVGQSLVVSQKQIIAVEALEGTDNMIDRCKNLVCNYKENAILVKVKKPKQTKKADLPTIGIDTVENCYKAGIKGISVQAKSTLILEKEEVIKKIDQLQMFLVVR